MSAARAGPDGGGLDWSGLMRVGMGPRGQGGLGLLPQQFWSLSPAELALMLGVSAASGSMTRDRLAALAARFPDVAAPVPPQAAASPLAQHPDRGPLVSD